MNELSAKKQSNTNFTSHTFDYLTSVCIQVSKKNIAGQINDELNDRIQCFKFLQVSHLTQFLKFRFQ